MEILVCGGAGYIGSHMVRLLAEQGHVVVTFDNLSTGHAEAVQWGEVVVGDVLDAAAVDAVLSRRNFDAVLHFAARSLVGESVSLPYDYYRSNVAGSLMLVSAMQRHGVEKLIFSSSAAVFGSSAVPIVDENQPLLPINPYGRSKLMVEQMLADAAEAYGLRSVCLRYFNAAGASRDARIGESHACETHLIPNVLRSMLGAAAPLQVFGDDYATPDGTCIRDYVHVEDLADAHLRALHFLEQAPGAHAFNLGNGQGFSVRQVIDAASRVVGRPVPYQVAPRRSGDPEILVASSRKAREVLGWDARWTELDGIIESAWRWHRAQPW
ncbi:UDP-glucose 4-epimerase GalE [Stenotrophomonas sp.]|uniref:UDP-glucose 4-epimerase GalE n=1 Tax=Stenotrophomonas sp. TaxID=69392 RepID=UPI0028A5CAD3|nr:UDP-glucose 4-epimerase GalE [Stenotrophomonas sp.]